MKNNTCQSCGMPLHNAEMYGTGENGLPIEDYCVHCYKDGAFTEDVTMEEMINLCARFVNGNSREAFIANMKTKFPRLKRWAQKESTQHEYHKSINKVLAYIQEHLDEETDLKTLSGIANISPYHFHRIFKTTIGEPLAGYVKRLRLEYVAEQLKTSKLSLSELASKTGYSSEQALSRAFKGYYKLPPSAFKASFLKEKYQNELAPRICKVAGKDIFTLHENNPDSHNWQKLYTYALFNNLLTESTESLEMIQNNVFRPCLTTSKDLLSNKHIQVFTLSNGIYAIFTHKGSIKNISELYNTIIDYWIPTSKYSLSISAIPYIKYLSNASHVPEEDLLTEIYIPITEK